METKIVGTTMPVLELNMQPNEQVFAESGELSWMSMAMQMRTSTSAGGQQGGFLGALGRAMAGGTLFMTEYTAVGGPGLLAFAAKLPGQILPVDIEPGQGYLVHRHGFMCATIGTQFSIGFQQRLGAGVFGGTGFRLQRLQGKGRAWVELHGEVVTLSQDAIPRDNAGKSDPLKQGTGDAGASEPAASRASAASSARKQNKRCTLFSVIAAAALLP